MAINEKSISSIQIGNEEFPFDAITVGGKSIEEIGELVTSIDSSSTNSQYPSAKCIYETVYGEVPPPHDYSQDYLTFDVLTDGTIDWELVESAGSGIAKTISYSKDNGSTWTEITSSTEGVSINVVAGDKVLVKGDNTGYGTSGYYNCFIGSAKYDVSGNIMSLIDSSDFSNLTTLSDDYTFCGLFQNSHVASAENLILPATTLSDYCYNSMFAAANYLISAPVLPAMVMSDYCYSNMFTYCSRLITAPALPATTLSVGCYGNMFGNCNNLRFAQSILPATTLYENCYAVMFQYCTSLISAPEINATTVVYGCCVNMFMGCTSLVNAPSVLPATTLANGCYVGMFQNCTSLIRAPYLPAVTVEGGCYQSMFSGCSSLNYIKFMALQVSSPSPLTYASMSNWMSGVASHGTAVINPNFCVGIVDDVNFIPSGWTAVKESNNPPAKYFEPLTYEITKAGTLALNGSILYSLDGGETWNTNQSTVLNVNVNDTVQIKGASGYSAGNNLKTVTNSSTANYNIKGNILSIKFGSLYPYITDFENWYTTCNLSSAFSGLNVVDASDLLLPFTDLTKLNNGTGSELYGLFENCTLLESAPALPATTLTPQCYKNMFTGCISLVNAPELPAATLANYSYRSMFEGCTSLETAPDLPAETVGYGGYWWMFMNCTSLETAPEFSTVSMGQSACYEMFKGCVSLETAPELPATTINSDCYFGMFYGCTGIINAPQILPATTIASSCYGNMFYNCSSLVNAPNLPAQNLPQSCYRSMFYGCSSLATAPVRIGDVGGTIGTYSCDGMFYGCSSLTTAPELPIARLANYSYRNMFTNCSHLNYIKCLATNISASSCTAGWTSGVSATGRFIKENDMENWTTGNSGIPSGWTVKNVLEKEEHQYVDLGLRKEINGQMYKVCFSTKNIGAENPEDEGTYFTWGDIVKHDNTITFNEYGSAEGLYGYLFNENPPYYSAESNYISTMSASEHRYSKYNEEDGLTELQPEDDAAYQLIEPINGIHWRIPSKEDWELFNTLSTEDVDWDHLENSISHQLGLGSLVVVGNEGYENNYLILPAAGLSGGTGALPVDENDVTYNYISEHRGSLSEEAWWGGYMYSNSMNAYRIAWSRTLDTEHSEVYYGYDYENEEEITETVYPNSYCYLTDGEGYGDGPDAYYSRGNAMNIRPVIYIPVE